MKLPDFVLELLNRPQCAALDRPRHKVRAACMRPEGHAGRHRDFIGRQFDAPPLFYFDPKELP